MMGCHCVFLGVLGRQRIVDGMEHKGGVRWSGGKARKEPGVNMQRYKHMRVGLERGE